MPAWRAALFFLVAIVLTVGLHRYLWARLVRDAALPPRLHRAATAAIVALGALTPVVLLAVRALPRAVASPLAFVVYLWMGLVFLLFVLLVPLDLARAVALRARPVDPARRRFLSRALAGAALAVGLTVTGAGVRAALARVGVKRVRVPLARLPKGAGGYRIVQISDVHVGPTVGREFIEEIVQTINALEPDAVAITGDLVDGPVARLGALVSPLRGLKARDGVFFVTGNHEYYSGVDQWIPFLEGLGVRVLRNERVTLREGLELAGVDDHSARAPGHGEDVTKALAGRDPAHAVVLLAHQPKTVIEAARHAVDLQLSGHTHGGQIWPWGYAVRLDQPHLAGLEDHGATKIYVSRGTGYWGPPMRVGAPAEIGLVELVCA